MGVVGFIPALVASIWGAVAALLVIGGGLVFLIVRAVMGHEVDRRVIFLFIFLSVAVPLLFPISFAERPTSIVRSVFDKIELLPPGSRILLSYDFDPAMAPEVQPMADAFTQHCLEKGHRIIYLCLWATGQGQFELTYNNVIAREFPDKVDGKDYVNLGYKAGNEGVLNVIVTDLKKMFPADVNGVPYDSIEILRGMKSCGDVDFAISIGGGKPGAKEWVLFVGDPGNVPMAGAVAAVSAPELYPYYPSQLIGILGGIKGAAEYESELRRQYPRFAQSDAAGLRMMGPQTLAHMVIMSFIVIGNLAYFIARRRDPRRAR